MTPLHYVARKGCFELVSALLEKGAAIDAKDDVRKEWTGPVLVRRVRVWFPELLFVVLMIFYIHVSMLTKRSATPSVARPRFCSGADEDPTSLCSTLCTCGGRQSTVG